MVSKEQVIKFIQKIHVPNWLVIILAVVIILRIPTFFEPYSYGDEMIYLTLGEGMSQGIPLYSGLHDNKPPLLYILAAISGRLFWFKAIFRPKSYIAWGFVWLDSHQRFNFSFSALLA